MEYTHVWELKYIYKSSLNNNNDNEAISKRININNIIDNYGNNNAIDNDKDKLQPGRYVQIHCCLSTDKTPL